jgi:hypothetical protein
VHEASPCHADGLARDVLTVRDEKKHCPGNILRCAFAGSVFAVPAF